MDRLVKLIYDLKDKRPIELKSTRPFMVTEDDMIFLGRCLMHFNVSKSQNFQDIFALHTTNKITGNFVEFGATDGISGSNTYLLENMGWRGVLAEPNPFWHDNLKKNRNVQICTDCVWKESDIDFHFNAVSKPDLSTIVGFGSNDEHAEQRKLGQLIRVRSISLIDLLKKYSSSFTIDYMSVDTEGSELPILEQFFEDIKKPYQGNNFQVNAFSVEHNFTPDREKIYKLMTDNGYVRKYEFISRWDDFYCRK
jgi:FkbM family methyltransferase